MKKIMSAALLIVLVSLNALASDYQVIETQKCKSRAEAAVLIKAQKEAYDPYDMISVMSRTKSVLEKDTLFHFVDISTTSQYKARMITVALDAKTCKIKSIN